MTEPTRFQLFSFWRTSATYRVRVALKFKGIYAQESNVNIDAGEQRTAEFLTLNPMGAIPALVDHAYSGLQSPVTQSLAILEFLEESYPAPALLPSDLHARARVRSLALMVAADTHPMITPRVKKVLASEAAFSDASWRAWQTHWLTTGLRAFEVRLNQEPGTARYCHGDTPTFADICLASIVVIARVLKIEVEGIPTIDRIMAQCEQLDAFAHSAPALQFGAP
jgi:maleylacetoacetate isomerase